MATVTEILVMTRTADTRTLIGPTAPPGVPLDYATIETFEVTGPYSLHEGQWLEPRTDVEAWKKANEKAGFRFESKGVQRTGALSKPAKLITPGESYTPPEVAKIVDRPEASVRKWLANWPAEEPRLNSRQQTGREPERLISAWDLLVFLNRYLETI